MMGYSCLVKMSKCLISLSLLIILSSCTSISAGRLDNLDYSINEIRQGCRRSLPVPFEYVSQDGRVLRSVPFIREGTTLVEAKDAIARAQLEVIIRGHSRPYNIEVNVPVSQAKNEVSLSKGYTKIASDDEVAKIFLARLNAYLTNRQAPPNIIDDYRPF